MRELRSRISHLASHISYLASRISHLSYFLCCCAAPSSAHEARPAYLEIKETVPGTVQRAFVYASLAGMRLPIVLKIPDAVRNLKAPIVQELADSLVDGA